MSRTWWRGRPTTSTPGIAPGTCTARAGRHGTDGRRGRTLEVGATLLTGAATACGCGTERRLVEVDSAAAQLERVDGVRESRWLTPVASTMAAISGRMIEYSPVSSNMMTTAVIGARAAPANTAPMPISP